MKPLQFLLMVLTLANLSPAAANVREHTAKILNFRVSEILYHRGEGLRACARTSKQSAASENQKFHARFDDLNKTYFNSYQERLETFLELLGTTQHHPVCQAEIAHADQKLRNIQRKTFVVPSAIAQSACLASPVLTILKCHQQVKALITELDPFCATQNSENYFGVKDPNPCMAGDSILAKTLRRPQDPTQENLTRFLNSLEAAVRAASPGSQLDLWHVFRETHRDDVENRKLFLGFLNFFYYAMGSAGGYVDGISDVYWISAVNDGNSARDIFPEFFSLRQKVDRYGFIIKKLAKDKGMSFTMNGRSVTDLNRHDFMSMFLACHFKPYGNLASRIIPKLLGTGYESLDFVSHIRSNVGVRTSVENFRVDTARYAQGSNWGNAFCSFKI
ncbi:MAG TPA: hypothetical protein VNJ01_08665 [Bacteriovoracaceae bacterium]|nr:hypothetical protein [Bacteriovoracaceae bacterium]